jgi:hypothetical protein
VDELEDLLKRYRPSGPPAELRGRVLGEEPVGRPSQGQRWREWLLPAAAAAAAVVFYVLGSGVQREMGRVESSEEAREAAIAAMTANLGGDDLARMHAERLMNLMESQPREDPPLRALLPGEVMP